MNEPETTVPVDEHPRVRDYGLVCMGALTLMVVALLMRRPDPWALFPALLGGMGLLFRWRAAPLIVLLAVVLLIWAWWQGTNPAQLVFYVLLCFRIWLAGWWFLPQFRTGIPSRAVVPLSDLLLALSLLAYAAGQYRLQGLVKRLFPVDRKQRRAAARQGPEEAGKLDESLRRSPDRVTTGEIVAILVGLAACGGVALLFWTWLRGRRTDLIFEDSAWQGILVLWLLGGGGLVLAACLRYLALRQVTPAEAQMILQDEVWRETRREQRRLNRWLAWAWITRRRREEKEQL